MTKIKKVEEDLEEIKASLNSLTQTVDSLTQTVDRVVQQQAVLMTLVDQFKELNNVIKEKDKKIDMLERRIDDLEQYSRLEDLIITGLATKHRSYARATATGGGAAEPGGDESPAEELQTLEEQVVKFFKSSDMPLESKNIAACHTLPIKNRNSVPAIIVRFVNRKHKSELLRQAKKLKGSDVYLNEHLTKRNAEIAKQARTMKKAKKIQATWTRNCKVMIKLNGEPEEAKVIMIKDLKELEKYNGDGAAAAD